MPNSSQTDYSHATCAGIELVTDLDDQTQADSKPAGQPEHASLNQPQLIALNWCPAVGGDQVSL